MKKIYPIAEACVNDGGETVLGSRELGTHACYLVYGTLKEDERGRTLRPGSGHEEILCVVQGTALLRNAQHSIPLATGSAVHLVGDEEYALDNTGTNEVVYVLAGGHQEAHHH